MDMVRQHQNLAAGQPTTPGAVKKIQGILASLMQDGIIASYYINSVSASYGVHFYLEITKNKVIEGYASLNHIVLDYAPGDGRKFRGKTIARKIILKFAKLLGLKKYHLSERWNPRKDCAIGWKITLL